VPQINPPTYPVSTVPQDQGKVTVITQYMADATLTTHTYRITGPTHTRYGVLKNVTVGYGTPYPMAAGECAGLQQLT
jgi:hypothetical protein